MSNMRNHGSRGSTFISVTIFSFILFVMSAGFLALTTGEYKLNRRSRDGAVAINLAEAGVEYILWEMNLPTPQAVCGTTISPTPLQAADGRSIGEYDGTVECQDGVYIVSTGYVPNSASPGNIHRTVRVKLKSRYFEPFQGMFFGNDYVHMHGTTSTNSYDHTHGAYGGGNIYSNGDIATYGSIINLTGDTVVDGHASTGPDGMVTGGGTITGGTDDTQTPESDPPLPAVTVPSELVGLPYGINGEFTDGLLTRTGSGTAEIPPGNWKLKRIKLTASAVVTITGPAKIYLTGDTGASIAQTGANSQIICNGKVEFYVDKDVTSSGQGIVNVGSNPNPADCMIWGTSTCTSIKLSGGSTTYSVVYAPAAVIDPSGGGDRYGAFVGKEVDCSGSGNYHYDEALGEIGIGNSTGYEPSYWQEK